MLDAVTSLPDWLRAIGAVAIFCADAVLFILIWHKTNSRPLPRLLRQARIFQAFDTLDRDNYLAGLVRPRRQGTSK